MGVQRHMRIVDSEASEDIAVKIAFATTDMRHVNQHFGSAKSFALYEVGLNHAGLIEAAEFGRLAQDGNEDKLAAKIEVLAGCAAVFCQAIGASAVRQLLAKGIQPVKVTPGAEIGELLESLREQLAEGPSAWLAQAIQRQRRDDPGRFDDMESEGWEEWEE
ncbi:MAG: NifB/NifX family molybdenum-iron cluster-binding protein [Methylohalobius sp. ZOD2]